MATRKRKGDITSKFYKKHRWTEVENGVRTVVGLDDKIMTDEEFEVFLEEAREMGRQLIRAREEHYNRIQNESENENNLTLQNNLPPTNPALDDHAPDQPSHEDIRFPDDEYDHPMPFPEDSAIQRTDGDDPATERTIWLECHKNPHKLSHAERKKRFLSNWDAARPYMRAEHVSTSIGADLDEVDCTRNESKRSNCSE